MELEELPSRQPRFNITVPEARPPPPPATAWARFRAALAGDQGRLLATAGKGLAWLGLSFTALNYLGEVFAAFTAGAIAADLVTFCFFRLLELPAHRTATGLETLINVSVIYLVVDLAGLFDTFRDAELLPFGLVAFLGLGIGKGAFWIHHRVAGN